MVGFYTSIIFIGIMLIVLSLIWILYDKKEGYDAELRMDEKRAELLKIISDAEVLVDELNKFSDYVITRIEEKNNEMDSKFIEAEELIESMKNEMVSFNLYQREALENSCSVDINQNITKEDSNQNNVAANIDNTLENVNPEESLEELSEVSKDGEPVSDNKEEVSGVISKHDEVIMLAKKGLSETEIARRLNIGRGEIQLILGVNR